MTHQAIIIRGPLGVGKSTIAKLVAKELNAQYVSIDEILTENKLGTIDNQLGCIPKEQFEKANDLLLAKLEKHTSVVIDGNFYHKNVLTQLLAHLTQFTTTVITLKARLETCLKRDQARINPHGEIATKAVHELVSTFAVGIVIQNDDSDIIAKVKTILASLN